MTAFSTATESASLTVTAVNDAPGLSVASGLTSVGEDAGTNSGTLVSNLAGWASDVDAGALEGLAITGVDNGNGTWQYTLDGTNWLEIGNVSSSSARLLPSDAVTRIRFVPDPNWNGSTGLTSYKAWDQTAGTSGGLADVTVNGGSTAFSTGTSGTTLSVSAVNDAPTATAGSVSLAAVPEDTAGPAGATVSSLFGSVFSDTADEVAGGSSANAFAGVAIVANAANAATQGVWQWFDGSGWGNIATSVSSSSALALAPAAPVRFLPAADYNGTPGALTARLVDDSAGPLTSGSTVAVGTGGGTSRVSGAADAVTLGTSISAVNDSPVAVDNAIAGANEGTAFAFMSSILSNDSDVDGDTLTALLVSGPSRAESFTLDPDGSFTYRHDGSETTSDSFVYRASDGNGGLADATVYLTIAPWNDAPAATIAQPTYAATEQTALTLHGTGLSVADPDAGAANVQATLSVTSGTLTASAGTTGATVADSGTGSLTIGGTVTRINDLLAGNLGGSLTYLDASDTPPASDTLTLQIDDLGNTGGGGARTASDTALITITAVNDAPVITSNGGGSAAAISVPESTVALGTVTSTDVDGGAPLYSILPGVDGARFGIDASTGALSFATAPDFENPADVGADNVYDVIVQVDDGSGGTDTQSVAVTVTDVGDGIRVTPSSVVPIGGETIVNGTTPNDQVIGANVSQGIATDANGNYVVVWASNLQDGSGYGIYARRFNADGTSQGAEFRVNSTTANDQINPGVAMDAAGNFVVTWGSALQDDGISSGVYAQRYDGAGVAQGSEFRVNTTIAGSQSGPAIAMAPGGAFVITWNSATQDPDGTAGIYAQRFSSSGAAQGGEFQVNVYTPDYQQLSWVSMDAVGNFVVTWGSNGQDGSNYGIYGRRFDAGGSPQGSEFRVNTTTANSQLYNDVAMLADGRFVVVYQSVNGGGNLDLFLQRYAADGTAVGGETQINTVSDPSYFPIPSVAADASGNIVVVWNTSGDGANEGVFGRRYDWSGAPLAGEFQVNAMSVGRQLYPEVVVQPGGRLIVAWSGNGPGDPDGVFVQRYGLRTTEAGGTATFSVVLEASPTGDVVIPISLPDGTEGTISTESLTFTNANWSTPQTVTLTGIQDYLNDGDAVYQVILGTASSGDPNFSGLNPADLSVTNLEVPNLAPVNTVPGTQTTNEELPLVFMAGTNPVSVTDLDAGVSPMQVTLTATNGTLSLNGTLGLTFSVGDGSADATMTFAGAVTAVNSALNGLIFTPSSDFFGSASVQIVTDDQGNTGTGGAKTDTDTVSITVGAVADTPSVTGTSTSEDTQSSSGLVISRNAADGVEVTHVKVTGISNGTLYKGDGTTQITNGSFVTFAEGNAGLRFSPAANFVGSAGFTVQASISNADVGLGGSTVNATITVTPVNDAPTATIGPSAYGVNEDDGYRSLSGISVSDPDAGSNELAVTLSVSQGLIRLGTTTGLTFTAGANDGAGMTFTGTIATLNTALATVTYRPGPNYAATDDLALSVDDQGNTGGGALSDGDSANIVVAPVNDAPIRTGGSTTDLTVLEDSGLTTLGFGGVAYGPGGGADESGQTLSYAVTTLPSSSIGDVFLADGTTQVALGAYTLAEIQGMQFKPVANASGITGLQFTVTDSGGTANGGLNSLSQFILITVTSVNDAPTLGNGTLASVGEDTAAPAGQLLSTVFAGQFADVDAGSSLAGVAVVGNTANAGSEGVWQYSSDGGGNWFAIGSVADGAGSLAVSSASLIRFVPAADFSGSPTPLVVRGLDDSYGAGFSTTSGSETRVTVDTSSKGGSTAIAAATATLATTITPANDAPVVTTSGGALAYLENDLATAVDPGVTVADPDSVSLASATVQITANYAAGEDVLSFANTASIFGSWNALNGTLTLTGSDTVANYEAALRTVKYANASESPSTALRTVGFTVFDGALNSNTASRSVTVTPVNDQPGAVAGSDTVMEDAASLAVDLRGVGGGCGDGGREPLVCDRVGPGGGGGRVDGDGDERGVLVRSGARLQRQRLVHLSGERPW